MTWGVSALARTIHVPDEAPTIQAGLDSLQNGDTVAVALGTYAEALQAPPLRFVLRGDVVPDSGDYPRPLIDPSSLPHADSLTCLRLPLGSHPVIEDLAFRNGPEMYPHFWNDGGISCRAFDAIIRRVVMDSVQRPLTHINNDTNSTVTLENCRFKYVFERGVYSTRAVIATDCYFSQNGAVLLDCFIHSRIARCTFTSNGPSQNEVVFLSGYADVRIEECLVEGEIVLHAPRYDVFCTNNVFPYVTGSGPTVYIDYSAGPGWETTVYIEGNSFIENHINGPGVAGAIQFEAYPGWDVPHLATITHNLFVNCSGPGSSAIRLCDAADVIGNRFIHLSPHTTPAVRLFYSSSLDTAVNVRDNLFYDTGIALEDDAVLPIDARWNWWGDSTGPYHAVQNPGGQGDTIIGDVDFIPWYPDTSFLMNVPGIRQPLPREFVFEAYPNPFNGTVTLNLIPPEVMMVRVELFDVLGRKVKDIWSGPLAFEKRITFDGSQLSSGIYFARVWQPIGNRPVALKKLMLLK
jgi:hypothetical protein